MFCKECGAEIPDGSVHCSECGAKLVDNKPSVEQSESVKKESFFKKNKKVLIGCCVGLFVIFLIVAISSLHSDNDSDKDSHISNTIEDVNISESDFKNNCTSIEYAQLTKNSDKFYGNRTVVSGTVLQIMEDNDGGIIRLATDGGYDDVVAVIYSGTNDVVDGDSITVYGYVAHDYSYESQANMQITLPCINAKYIDKT